MYANFLDTPNEKDNVKGILATLGATVTETATTDPATLESQLLGKDAFVIPELKDDSFLDAATCATITTTFTGFAPILGRFLQAGHKNVVLTEGDLEAAWGVQCVSNSLGFTTATVADERIDVVPLTIADPTDPLMTDIAPPLNTAGGWMSFTSTDPTLHVVATTAAGNIVITEKTVGLGRYIILGFDYFAFNAKMADILGNAILKAAGDIGISSVLTIPQPENGHIELQTSEKVTFLISVVNSGNTKQDVTTAVFAFDGTKDPLEACRSPALPIQPGEKVIFNCVWDTIGWEKQKWFTQARAFFTDLKVDDNPLDNFMLGPGVIILPFHDVGIDALQGIRTQPAPSAGQVVVHPGDLVRFTFSVVNTGNEKQDVIASLHVTSSEKVPVDIVVCDQPLTLQPDTKQDVTCTWDTTDAHVQKYASRAEVRFSDETKTDKNPDNNSLDGPSITVQARHDVLIDPVLGVRTIPVATAPSPEHPTGLTVVQPGDTVFFSFRVRNDGKETQTVDAFVEITLHGNVVARIPCAKRDIAPGSSFLVPTSGVPEDCSWNTTGAEVQIYDMAAVVEFQVLSKLDQQPLNNRLDGPQIKIRGVHDVAVDSFHGVTTDPAPSPDQVLVHAGTTVHFTFSVVNEGKTAQAVRAFLEVSGDHVFDRILCHLTGPDHGVEQFTLQPDEKRTVECHWDTTGFQATLKYSTTAVVEFTDQTKADENSKNNMHPGPSVTVHAVHDVAIDPNDPVRTFPRPDATGRVIVKAGQTVTFSFSVLNQGKEVQAVDAFMEIGSLAPLFCEKFLLQPNEERFVKCLWDTSRALPGQYSTMAGVVFQDPTKTDENPKNDMLAGPGVTVQEPDATSDPVLTLLLEIRETLATLVQGQTTFQESLDLLEPRLTAIEGNVGRIDTRIGEVVIPDLTSIGTKVTRIDGSVANVLVPGIGRIDTTLDSIDATLTSIDGRFFTINTSLGQITGDISQINGRLVDIKNGVVSIDSSMGLIRLDTSSIKATVESTNGIVTDVLSNLGSLRELASSINTRLTSIDGRIVTIDTSLGSVSRDIGQINGRLVTIDGTVATIRTDVGDLQTDLSTLNTRVTGIDGRVVTIDTSLGPIRGTVDKINGDTVSIRTDVGTLRADVSTLKDNAPLLATGVNYTAITAVLAGIAMVGAILSAALIVRKVK